MSSAFAGSFGAGSKEPDLDDESTEIDLSRLPAADRDAILARVAPDESAPPDAYALAQNEIRREVGQSAHIHAAALRNDQYGTNNGLHILMSR